MTQYACVQCCQPAQPGDYDCPRCGGALAEVLEPSGRLQLASPEQRALIHGCYKRHGLHDRAWIFSDLSHRLGRNITRYEQVTAAEARLVLPQLKEWSYGIRR